MKKLLLLSASMLALSSQGFAPSVHAQNNVDVMAVTQTQQSQIQTDYDQAIQSFQSQYPNTHITDVDIHLHQETGHFVVRVLGADQSQEYQLITYNGEQFNASRPLEEANSTSQTLNPAELASLETVTQNAIQQAQSDKAVNWSLEGHEDTDAPRWDVTFIEDNQEKNVAVDATTGEVIDSTQDSATQESADTQQAPNASQNTDQDRSDNSDARHFYRQFYSDYNGTRPTVRDAGYQIGNTPSNSSQTTGPATSTVGQYDDDDWDDYDDYNDYDDYDGDDD